MSTRTTLRAHAQRIPHLVTRFVASLRARPLDDATDAWVASALATGERAAWNGMGRADRAEGVAVARRLVDELQRTSEPADPRWTAAALLHDAGKQLSGYGTVARAAVTAIGMAAGDARLREWATTGRGARARMGRYVAHDELGAQLLSDLGARPEVAAWAVAHHRPDRWPATGIPPAVCRALAAADGEPPGVN